MTQEFLFFADIVLLLRFRLLLAETLVPARRWWWKAAIESGLIVLFVPLVLGSVAAIVASLVLAAVTIFWVPRVRDRNTAHLVLGFGHLAVLGFCFGPALGPPLRPWVLSGNQFLLESSAFGAGLFALGQPAALKFLFGLLLASNEANLLVRSVLARLQLKPGGPQGEGIDAKEYTRGRVIGLLERGLIYFFVLGGQYGAVGFTLAAKGFTRFKELENRSFAEYVLIGTLLSSGLSMVIAAAVRFL